MDVIKQMLTGVSADKRVLVLLIGASLAMPGIAGPGTIAVVIGISTEIAEIDDWAAMSLAFFWTTLAIIVAAAASWFVMRYSESIARRLGPSGTLVLGKLMGFLLICIGVQFVGSGIRTFMAGG